MRETRQEDIALGGNSVGGIIKSFERRDETTTRVVN